MDLFEHIENFFKRLGVYNQISLTTEMAEVLVKIVIELLSILSIATKEVKRPLASEFPLPEREISYTSLARHSYFCRAVRQKANGEG